MGSELSVYQTYTDKINGVISDIKNDFMFLGLLFSEVKANGCYLEKGYNDVFEYAETEFKLGKSTVYNLINVNLKFHGDNHMCLDERFKDYSYSQLVELVPCDYDDIRKNFNPDMTIKEMKQCKKDLKYQKDNLQQLEFENSKRLENGEKRNEEFLLHFNFVTVANEPVIDRFQDIIEYFMKQSIDKFPNSDDHTYGITITKTR